MKSIPAACAEQAQMRDWEEIGELGRGSNGVVYHVRNRVTGQEAALKWIHIEYGGESGLSLQEFREAQTQLLDEINFMQKLSRTPQIVGIQDYAFHISSDGTCMDTCIRMELLTPLVKLLQNRSISVGKTARLVRDIVGALSACHREGIIHGDVKPENILCSGDDFKLSDFGVSLQLQRKFYRSVRGTQYFQPPEVRQSREASVSSDVYSLGMTLYVLFNNGMLPFQTQLNRADEQEAWRKCCDMPRVPGSRYPAPGYAPAEVAEVILRATALEETERYQTLQALADDFSAAIAALPDNQKLMPLPYFRAEETSGGHDRVYLSTNRRTFDPSQMGRSQETAEKPASAARNAASGFVLPGTTTQEKKPSEEEKKPVTVEKKPEKRKSRLPLILAAVLLVAALAVGVVMLLGQSGGVPMTVAVEPGLFGASASVANAPEGAVAQLCVAGAEVSSDVAIVDGMVQLTGLAPETDYVLTVTAGKETSEARFRTLPPVQGRFRPTTQVISTCEASLPEMAESKEDLAMDKGLTDLAGGLLKLRAARMSEQNLAVLLYCGGTCEPGSYEQSSMYLVLRAPDDVCVAEIEAAAMELTDGHFWTIENFTSLLEMYYGRHGRYYQGRARLEIYWQDALLGSADLTLE